MKSLKSIGLAIFALIVMFVATTHAAEGGSRVNSDIEAIQSEIQNAQRAFTQVRKSKGKNIQQFDAAIKRLRIKINALNASLKSPKQGSVASSKDLGDSASRLNAYFRSLEKARAQSKWRVVESDLGRLVSSAKDLHSAALKVPGVPSSAPRTPPKPPATGPSGTPSVTATPKPKPDSRPRTVGPYKPPLPVTRGPGPKGPDDPRFRVAPFPPVPPEEPPEPPPPDDGRGGKVMPMPMEEPAGQGSPPMMRKPARPPVRIQDDIPRPKPKRSRKPVSPEHPQKLDESQKIQHFLKELEGANSFPEVRKAYEKGDFTESEIKNLEQQVLVSRYSKKLQELAEREKRKSSFAMKKNTEALISARRNALERRQQQELNRLNEQAETTLRHLQTKTSHQLKVAPIAEKVYETANDNLAANSRAIDMDSRHESLPPKEDFGEILSIQGNFSDRSMLGQHTETGEVERGITITGNYFRNIAGAVDFLPASLSDQRRLVPFSIDSWSEHQITGRILRQDIESLLGYGSHRGMIRVKRRGNNSGPKSAFWIYIPQPPPEITGISTAEGSLSERFITPGQTIIIMGNHFTPVPRNIARDDPPRVELQHSSGLTTSLIVREFDTTWIRAELRLIEGVPSSHGILRVIRPGAEKDSIIDIEFRPTLNTWVFEEIMEHHCSGFFGFKDTVTLHDHSLSNEWKVVNHDVRNGGWGGRGCNWIERPNVGSTETAARLEYWCDLFSTIFCTSEVTIEGPAGIHWQ